MRRHWLRPTSCHSPMPPSTRCSSCTGWKSPTIRANSCGKSGAYWHPAAGFCSSSPIAEAYGPGPNKTPFGHGRPYTRGQLTDLLRDTLFSPLAWSEALAVPPISRRPWVRTGTNWERVGRFLWPAFAGVYRGGSIETALSGHSGPRQAQPQGFAPADACSRDGVRAAVASGVGCL